jgi:hypothetical protein
MTKAWERAGVNRGRILADSMRLSIRVLSLRQLPANP